MSHGLQIVLRLVHIVLGAYWVGSVFFLAMFLEPSIRAAGPDGGKVMLQIFNRGFLKFVPFMAVLTVVAGIWLLYIWSNGFDPSQMGSPMGIVLSTGGAFGIVALAVGAGVMAPTGNRMWKIALRMPAVTEDAERTALTADMGRLRPRMAVAGRIVAVLLLVAICCMAVARYV